MADPISVWRCRRDRSNVPVLSITVQCKSRHERSVAHVAKGCFAPACRGHKDTLRPTWTPPAQSVCNRLAAVRPTTLGSSFRVWAKPRPSFRHPTPKGCCRSFPTISFRTGLREQDPNKARVRISHFGGRCMVYHDTYRCRSWSWIEVRDRENCERLRCRSPIPSL